MQLARGLDAGEDARHGLTTYAGRVRRRKVRELKDLVDVAKTAAARAATYLRGLTPAAPSDWTEKGPHDFVTDADRAAPAPGRANAGSVSRGSRKHATHSWALAFPSRTFRGCGATWTNSPPSWEPRAASVAPARPHSTSST